MSLEEMKATLVLHPASDVDMLSNHSVLSACCCKTAAFSMRVHVQIFTKDMGLSSYCDNVFKKGKKQ